MKIGRRSSCRLIFQSLHQRRYGRKLLKDEKAPSYSHYIMFVRFSQQSSNRLNISIVESSRIAGKLKHDHIAAHSSIESPTIAARITD
jgi:hypothetical protein